MMIVNNRTQGDKGNKGIILLPIQILIQDPSPAQRVTISCQDTNLEMSRPPSEQGKLQSRQGLRNRMGESSSKWSGVRSQRQGPCIVKEEPICQPRRTQITTQTIHTRSSLIDYVFPFHMQVTFCPSRYVTNTHNLSFSVHHSSLLLEGFMFPSLVR